MDGKSTKNAKDNKAKAKKYLIQNLILLIPALYIGGILGQILLGNQQLDIVTGEADSKLLLAFVPVLRWTVTHIYGWVGFALALVGLNFLVYYVLLHFFTPSGTYDEERNLYYSDKGTYGTSGWMSEDEKSEVFNRYHSPANTNEIILGREMDSDDILTIPSDARMNKHIAIYGASGTGKSRAFARPYMLQGIKRGESFIVTDPKGELFESMGPYFRKNGYDVKVLNLVNLEHSDSWNCLTEIEGSDLRAQIFADVIIQNTSGRGGTGDFWSQCEMNLLKALCLYVERNPGLDSTMKEVYTLLTTKSPIELDRMFDELPFDPVNQAAKSAYNIFRQAGENVKGGVIIGLGSRLQVFQGGLVQQITSHQEIQLTKPGQEKCAYFCITSDQHSAFDFLAALFYSMLFIRLVEYADLQPGCRCAVPVNFLLDEFPNIGAIPDFTKKISTVRSRGLNIAVIFQNIAQLQNRYPQGQWEEILGNCDTHLFLGCTDQTTAKFVSDRTGIVTVGVTSQSRDRKHIAIQNSLDVKESSSVGKRNLLTPDEVLRIPNDQSLILIRGRKPVKARKFDYSLHPDAEKLEDGRVMDYVPEWKKNENLNPDPASTLSEEDDDDTVDGVPSTIIENIKPYTKRPPKKPNGSSGKPSGFR